MLILWLAFAVGLTMLGAIIAFATQDAEVEHDEEIEYGSRIVSQRVSIETAQQHSDPHCRETHAGSDCMLALYRDTQP